MWALGKARSKKISYYKYAKTVGLPAWYLSSKPWDCYMTCMVANPPGDYYLTASVVM